MNELKMNFEKRIAIAWRTYDVNINESTTSSFEMRATTEGDEGRFMLACEKISPG